VTDSRAVHSTTRYARSEDGAHIAFQVTGDGPIDVLVIPGFVSHVELAWDVPLFIGPLLRWLGRFARVIHLDKRGTGLSDRAIGAPSLELRMDDLRAVMDEAGCERASIVGISEGGPLSLLFAASHPERTAALVLIGSFARLAKGSNQDFGYTEEEATLIAASFEADWGTGKVLGAFFPEAANDVWLSEQMARYERNSASPDAIGGIIRQLGEIDVRPVLESVTVPTLVLHRVGDPIVPVRCGEDLAARIPNARLILLSGVEHLPSGGPALDDFGEVEVFLAGHRLESRADRVLATVLFTDIVGSTAHAAKVGDASWHDLLDHHDVLMRTLIERHRGRAVKSTGDGYLAIFDGPARAVSCALDAADEVRSLGVALRAGVHTGECEERDGDFGGIAVHIAARICDLAEVGQVLVSRTVTDLVVGSGLRFAEHGEHDLRDVPGSWPLFSVDPRPRVAAPVR
jgi:class 3 adenylate cyclase/pimeloyl-ACP methyl ester carboxylesterase